MSAFDKRVSWYRHLDITDPTPYETDDRIFEGHECQLCGREFYRGEDVMELKHRELSHDRFLHHWQCFHDRWPIQNERDSLMDALDDLGFEIFEEVET